MPACALPPTAAAAELRIVAAELEESASLLLELHSILQEATTSDLRDQASEQASGHAKLWPAGWWSVWSLLQSPLASLMARPGPADHRAAQGGVRLCLARPRHRGGPAQGARHHAAVHRRGGAWRRADGRRRRWPHGRPAGGGPRRTAAGARAGELVPQGAPVLHPLLPLPHLFVCVPWLALQAGAGSAAGTPLLGMDEGVRGAPASAHRSVSQVVKRPKGRGTHCAAASACLPHALSVQAGGAARGQRRQRRRRGDGHDRGGGRRCRGRPG